MSEFLDFLLWWSVFSVAYCLLIFAADWLIGEYQERQRRRRTLQRRLDRIDAEMASSVRRLSVAFLHAQREIQQVSTGEDHHQ